VGNLDARATKFFYFTNDADLIALRYDAWKISFKNPPRGKKAEAVRCWPCDIEPAKQALATQCHFCQFHPLA
jgi:hypothetical protein